MTFSLLRRAGLFLLDILFPCSCLGCGADTTKSRAVLCGACFDSIPVHSALFCPLCMGRIPSPNLRCHPATFLAGAAASYDKPAVKELIHVLKYKGARSAARPLGALLARYLERAAPPELLARAVLAPIPLSAGRARERGYNQAEEIAKVTAELLKLPLDASIIGRIRHTKPQTEIAARDARLKNVIGSFKASEGARGKNIILIDDVYTTGGTMSEAVKTLKAAGARRVIAIAAARA